MVEQTSLQIEPLALMAAEVDKNRGLLTFIVIEQGASSKLCSTFKINEPISLMGPTGVRAKISHEHETVLIMGNQLSLALVSSYGNALRAMGNRVIYLGSFKNKDEVYCQNKVEQATDLVIWTVQEGPPIATNRKQDFSYQGDPIQSLLTYAKNPNIPLSDVDRIYLIGNSDFLRRMQDARKNTFKEFFIKDPVVYGSVYSTMQCMLKGVCAQCLQWQVDPETGLRTKAVFACSWQDQPLELIDFDNLEERQIQNRLQEVLTNLWVNYLFTHYSVNRI
jgi:NAD(P)H-flavin reductase